MLLEARVSVFIQKKTMWYNDILVVCGSMSVVAVVCVVVVSPHANTLKLAVTQKETSNALL